MRHFGSTRALLLRRGRVVARMEQANGMAGPKSVKFRGTTTERSDWWVAPGVAVEIAWQVDPRQRNSAWLVAPVTITDVVEREVRVAGTTPCRPYTGERPA